MFKITTIDPNYWEDYENNNNNIPIYIESLNIDVNNHKTYIPVNRKINDSDSVTIQFLEITNDNFFKYCNIYNSKYDEIKNQIIKNYNDLKNNEKTISFHIINSSDLVPLLNNNASLRKLSLLALLK